MIIHAVHRHLLCIMILSGINIYSIYIVLLFRLLIVMLRQVQYDFMWWRLEICFLQTKSLNDPTENSYFQQLRHWHLWFSTPLGHRFPHQWSFGFCSLPCQPLPQSSRCFLVQLLQPRTVQVMFGCISITQVKNLTQLFFQTYNLSIEILQMRHWPNSEDLCRFQRSCPVDAHITQQPWHIEYIGDIWHGVETVHSSNINNSCTQFFYQCYIWNIAKPMTSCSGATVLETDSWSISHKDNKPSHWRAAVRLKYIRNVRCITTRAAPVSWWSLATLKGTLLFAFSIVSLFSHCDFVTQHAHILRTCFTKTLLPKTGQVTHWLTLRMVFGTHSQGDELGFGHLYGNS